MRPLVWVGKTYDDYKAFPANVQKNMGYALYLAQDGDKHPSAKPLKGFSGAGVLEVVENHDGNAYRAIYTVKFASAVYVLHAFQKKSKRGISTPQSELYMVRQNLRIAQERDQRSRNTEPGRAE